MVLRHPHLPPEHLRVATENLSKRFDQTKDSGSPDKEGKTLIKSISKKDLNLRSL
jgi:hypothetical protein